ncbi:ubiquinone biosynthesis hydrox [Schizophyllum commune Loenen D]|nr:ubiquinone biosynthesis hydrox [Schizophyllum commune Loenen D]
MSLTLTRRCARLTTRAARHNLLSFRCASTAAPEHSDVVIVGGGPAGLALASALASSRNVREKLRITLVEAGDLSKVRAWTQTDGYSNRCVSLTNDSTRFLRDIGAYSHVDEQRTCPVEELQVWDGISDARIQFSVTDLYNDASECDLQGMSRIIENLNLQRGLLRHLDTFPDIQLLDKTKVQTITPDEGATGSWPVLHLDNGHSIRARLLIGADGMNSPVRNFAGIDTFGWSYDTQAIVATLFHPPRGAYQPPNTTAYQRFLPTGPIAFLPLSPTASTLVWSTRPRIASALTKGDPQVLGHMINAAFRLPALSMDYLATRHSAYSSAVVTNEGTMPPADAEMVPPPVTSIQPGGVASFPLIFRHAQTYLGEGAGARTVLVGDAAHRAHPLAGQGLNLGLADVACLARVIEQAVSVGGDIGSYTSLLPYAQERYLENHKLMSAMDKLHKIYTTDLAPVVWARSVGVEVLNELDTIKAAMMLSAGSSPKPRPTEANPAANAWGVVASGLENLSTAVGVARTLGGGIPGVVATGLQGVLKGFGQKQ